MEEMKTLKDIDWKDLSIPDTVDIIDKDTLRHGKIALYPSTIIKHLKQEAIKQREYKFKMALNAPDRGTKEFLLGQCAFIEEFFDLEDLE